jgi:hypothetical protein
MFLHDVLHAAASHRAHYAPSLDRASGSRTPQCDQPARLQHQPMVCGQSRTTISARHFAALIGRLWIGGV